MRHCKSDTIFVTLKSSENTLTVKHVLIVTFGGAVIASEHYDSAWEQIKLVYGIVTGVRKLQFSINKRN